MTFFLIGFMGSGKTYWGKRWALYCGYQFIDLDEVIEKAEGKSIADIFEKNGETYFRVIEAAALRNLADIKNTVIACGGGTPCFHENMAWMKQHGTTIYLLTTVAQIVERVLLEQDKRPLLKKMNSGEMIFFIEQKLKERNPFYSAAQLIVPSAELSDDYLKNLIADNH